MMRPIAKSLYKQNFFGKSFIWKLKLSKIMSISYRLGKPILKKQEKESGQKTKFIFFCKKFNKGSFQLKYTDWEGF